MGEVFSTVNNLLCEANSEGLFITAFEGVLDLVTGEFCFVNAGHEMPFICKAGGSFEAYKIRPGFVLAGFEDMNYKAGSMTLDVGDLIFQYTDGVTEATNVENQLYGMERLEQVLNRVKDRTPSEILPEVKKDIDAFEMCIRDRRSRCQTSCPFLPYKPKAFLYSDVLLLLPQT